MTTKPKNFFAASLSEIFLLYKVSNILIYIEKNFNLQFSFKIVFKINVIKT